MLTGERGHVIGVRNNSPGWAWMPALAQGAAHLNLVLREAKCMRPRMDGNVFSNDGFEDVLGNMLMVERDDITLPGEGQHVFKIIVGAEHVGGHLRSRIVRTLRQYPKVDTERSGRLSRHATELSATDHAHCRAQRAHVTKP